MVEYADKDKDGTLSWEEFKEVVQKEYPNNA
jgi:Ca2+-binding EF-hand superfamily protein